MHGVRPTSSSACHERRVDAGDAPDGGALFVGIAERGASMARTTWCSRRAPAAVGPSRNALWLGDARRDERMRELQQNQRATRRATPGARH